MDKRPWNIDMSKYKEPTKVVKKSRAIGMSYIPTSDYSKVLREKGTK